LRSYVTHATSSATVHELLQLRLDLRDLGSARLSPRAGSGNMAVDFLKQGSNVFFAAAGALGVVGLQVGGGLELAKPRHVGRVHGLASR
jgi:hypothetical protein